MNTTHLTYQQCLTLDPETLRGYVRQLFRLACSEQENATDIQCDTQDLCRTTVARLEIIGDIIRILVVKNAALGDQDLVYPFNDTAQGRRSKSAIGRIIYHLILGTWPSQQLAIKAD